MRARGTRVPPGRRICSGDAAGGAAPRLGPRARLSPAPRPVRAHGWTPPPQAHRTAAPPRLGPLCAAPDGVSASGQDEARAARRGRRAGAARTPPGPARAGGPPRRPARGGRPAHPPADSRPRKAARVTTGPRRRAAVLATPPPRQRGWIAAWRTHRGVWRPHTGPGAAHPSIRDRARGHNTNAHTALAGPRPRPLQAGHGRIGRARPACRLVPAETLSQGLARVGGRRPMFT
jgi:hypothetical protein